MKVRSVEWGGGGLYFNIKLKNIVLEMFYNMFI